MRVRIVLLISLLVNPIYPQKSEPETVKKIPGHLYKIKMKSIGILAEVLLNGVSIQIPETEYWEGLINRWVYKGDNVITLRILSDDHLVDKRMMQFHVIRLDNVTGEIEKSPLTEFTWKPDEKSMNIPYEKKLKFEVKIPPPSELWKKAEHIEMDKNSRKGIIEKINEYYDALLRKDSNRLWEIVEFKYKDISQSELRDSANIKILRNEAEAALIPKGLVFDTLDPNELELHSVAEGRLIWLTGKDFSSPFKASMNGNPKETPTVYFAKVKGKWVIAR